MAVSAIVGGAFNVTVGGAGTYNPTAVNTYSGGTTFLTGGTMNLTTTNLPFVAGQTLTITGGTLLVNNTFTLANIISLQTGTSKATINVASGQTLTLNTVAADVITGSGSFVKTGLGTITQTEAAPNTNTGFVVLDQGIIGDTGAFLVYSGAFVINGGQYNEGVNGTASTVNMTVNSSGTWNETIAINMGVNVVLNGATLTDSAATVAFTPLLGHPIVVLANSTTTTSGGNAAWNLGAANTMLDFIVYKGSTPSGVDLDFAGTGIFDNTAGEGFNKLGAGTMQLSGTGVSVGSGLLNIDEGTVNLNKGAALSAWVGPITVGEFGNSAKLVVTSAFNQLGAAATVIVTTGSTYDVSGASNVAQAITTLQVIGGTVNIGGNTGGLTLTGNVTGVASNGATGTISSTAAGKLTLAAAGSIITVADSGTQTGLTINAAVAGAATSLTKLGAGTLTLNPPASDTYAGTTLVNEGTLVLGATTANVVTISTGAITVGDSIGGDSQDVLKFASGSVNTQIGTGVNVTINNSGKLDLNSIGTALSPVTIGSLTMQGGTFNVGTGYVILNGNIAGLFNAANVNDPYTATRANVATISGSGTLALGGAVRTIDVQQGLGSVIDAVTGVADLADMVIQPTIADGVSPSGLTKLDSGILRLTGAEPYTGATTVSGGTLLVDGSLSSSSAVTVSSNAVLGGNGTTGADTVSGGTVDPGDPVSTPGILTESSANFSSSGNLTIAITGAGTTSSPINYNQLNLGSGALTLGGTSTLTLNLAGLSTSISQSNAVEVVSYGSYSGNFTTVTTTNNSTYNFTPVLEYESNGLYVYLTAPATHLAFTTTAQTLTAGVTSGTLTVQLKDAYNNVAVATSPQTVSLTTNSGGGSFSSTPLTIGAGSSTASFTYTDTKSGTPTITATDTALSTQTVTQQETVTAAASQLVFTTLAQTLTAGVTSGTITVQLKDAYNNVAVATSPQTVSLTTNSGGGSFSSTPLTIGTGSSTASFTYTDTKSGTPTITATDTALSTQTVTQQETVIAASASHLVFTTLAQTLTAGVTSGTITVQLEDAYNNVAIASSTQTVSLSTTSSGGSFSSTALSISAGSSTASFTYTDTKSGTSTITATDFALETHTATQQETVNTAAASQLVFTTLAQTLTAGVTSGTLTVQLEDAYNNIVTATNPQTISLTTTSGGGSFSSTPLTIGTGSSTASFTYTDTKSGTPTITATDTALSTQTVTQQETVIATAASQLVFTSAAQTRTAGVTSGTLTVQLEDVYNNVAVATSPQTVSLTTTSGGGSFSSTPLTIGAGSSTASFTYTDTKSGTPTITASDTALPTQSITQQETVIAAVASQLVFTTLAQTLTAGVTSGTITVQLEDAYNNIAVATSQQTVSLTTTSGGGSFSSTPLTIGAGSSTASFTYTDTKSGTPTITATDTALSTQTVTQQETVIAAASQLVFMSAAQTLTAGVTSTTIIVQLEDAYNNVAVASGTQTILLFTTSSSGQLLVGSTPVTYVMIGTGSSTTSFTYTDTKFGTPTITATDFALATPTATQQETVIAAPASHLVFTTLAQTLTAGVTSGTVTVQLEDAYNNVAVATSPQTVGLTTTSGGGSFSSTPLTIGAGSSTASFTYTDTKSGTPTITATDTALSTQSVTQQETVNTAAASQLVFTTLAQTLTAGVTSGTVTVQLEDAYNNIVTATNPQTISLTTTSGGGSFSSTPQTIGTGSSTASFTYTDTKSGTPTITAIDTALSTQTVTQQETVNTAAASHLVFTTLAQTLTAGVTSGTLTVQLEDAYNNIVTATNPQTISLTTTSGGGSFSSTPLMIGTGSSTASFTYTDTKSGTPTITATDTALSTQTVTQQETVIATAASQLVFSTTAQTPTAGVTSGTITVQLEDVYNNVAVASSTQTILLSTTSSSGQFLVASTPVTFVTITSGNSGASFTYTDTKSGTPTITVTDFTLPTQTATQQETVNAGTASQLVFTTLAQTLTAGVTSGTLTVQLEDVYNNIAVATSPQTVSLTTNSGGGSFSSTPLTIGTGSSTASFTYTDTKSGTPTITATDTALSTQSVTQQETVNTAAASHLVFTTLAQTLTAGVTSGTLTVQLEDAYNNIVTATNPQTISLTTTSGGGSFSSTPLTIGTGSSTASFTYTDTKSGTPTITASDSALFTPTVTQQETVIAAVASQLVFTTLAQTLTAGVASGTLTLQLEDAYSNVAVAVASVPQTISLTTNSGGGSFLSTPLTIGTGSSTASFIYTDTKSGTPTITATDTALTTPTVTQQETVIAATASQLVFTTLAQTLTAGVTSGTITVQLEDVYNNVAVATSPQTVSLTTTSGGGSFSSTPQTIGTGSSTASFTYTDTKSGTPTITATDTALATQSVTQQETVNTAAASHLVFTTLAQTLTAGVTSGTLTVQLEDAYNNIVTATNPQTISLTTTSGGGSFSSTPLMIGTGSSTASFTYTDTKSGTPTITATDTALSTQSVTQQETVNTAAASHLVFTTLAQTLTAGVTSGTLTVQLEDAYNNIVTATNPQTVSLTTTSGGGSFSSTPLMIGAGSSTASFTYTDTKSGTPTITATDTALSTPTVTQQETVNAAAASHLVFTTLAQTLTAGVTSGTITVQLEDAYNNIAVAVASVPQTVSLTTTSGGGSFTSAPQTIGTGSSTASFTYTDTKSGTPTITATDTALTTPTVTQQETVIAAMASQLVFTTAAQTRTAGVTSGTITLQLEDAYNNVAVAIAGVPQTISLTTTSGGGSFSSTPLTISTGSSTASFTYTDTKSGTPTITATDTALTTPTVTQQETVIAAAASQLVFTSAAQTLTAGVTSGTLTVQLEDAYNNVAVAIAGVPQTISLTTTSGGGSFSSTPLTIGTGSSTASFTYTDTKSGTPTITATDTALSTQTVTQQETVIAAAASQLVFTTLAQTLTAGVTSGTLTVQLEDAYNNVAVAIAGVPQTVSLTTTSGGGSFSSTPLTIGTGSSTASFTYTDTKSGTPTITATDTALTTPTVTQQETVIAAAASQLVFTTAAQTLTAGVTSTTITVQLEDAYNNVAVTSVSQTVSLTTTSTAPFGVHFRDTGDTTNITGVTIIAGATSASFKYNDTLEGSPLLTASDSALTSPTATQTETVNAAAASAYRITAASSTPTAGSTDALAITLVDQYQNVESAFTGSKNLTFAGLGTAASGMSPTVTNSGGSAINAGASTTINFANGMSTGSGGVLVAYKEETATLTATDGTHTTGAAGARASA